MLLNNNSVMKEFRSWSSKNSLYGRHAFSRFVMLKYLEAISENSDEFIFKGGNLLWHYIKTPRSTIDLDLSTLKVNNHERVKDMLLRACNHFDEIEYSILKFIKNDKEKSIGAKVEMSYESSTGQRNKFRLDIMYGLPTDIKLVKSTISEKKLLSASIENIVADKLSAAHEYRSGNTRMKDFDDLWRISKSKMSLNSKIIIQICKERDIPFELESSWVSFMDKNWKIHCKEYKDLPKSLKTVFLEINTWLTTLKE